MKYFIKQSHKIPVGYRKQTIGIKYTPELTVKITSYHKKVIKGENLNISVRKGLGIFLKSLKLASEQFDWFV